MLFRSVGDRHRFVLRPGGRMRPVTRVTSIMVMRRCRMRRWHGRLVRHALMPWNHLAAAMEAASAHLGLDGFQTDASFVKTDRSRAGCEVDGDGGDTWQPTQVLFDHEWIEHIEKLPHVNCYGRHNRRLLSKSERMPAYNHPLFHGSRCQLPLQQPDFFG